MKSKYAIILLAIVLAGCKKGMQEHEAPQLPQGEYFITASVASEPVVKTTGAAKSLQGDSGFEVSPWEVDAPASRTSLGEQTQTGVKIHWGAGDRVGVSLVDVNNQIGPKAQYTLASGAGTSQATFSGSSALTAGERYIAIYPYDAATVIYSALNMTLPTTQTQSANNNSDHLSVSDFLYSPITTAVSNKGVPTADFHFHHFGTLLQFAVKVGSYSGSAPVELRGIKITCTDPVAPNIFNVDYTYLGSGTIGSFTPPVSSVRLVTNRHVFADSGPDAVYTALIVVSDAYGSWEKPLYIVLETSAGNFTFQKSVPNTGFMEGKRYKTELILNVAEPVGEWKWQSGVDPLPAKSGNVITVATAKDLAWVSGVSNRIITGSDMNGVTNPEFDGYVINMSADIDLTGKKWTPIGWHYTIIGQSDPYPTQFGGTFDGLGHAISGLTINKTEPSSGLFGILAGSGFSTAIIRNVRVVSGSVIGRSPVGAIVGLNSNGRIEGCRNEGCYVASDGTAGGITGRNGNSGIIRGCVNIADVTGCGITYNNTGKIYACLNTGTVNTGISFDNAGTIVSCIDGGNAIRSGSFGWNHPEGVMANCYYPAGGRLFWFNDGYTSQINPFTTPEDIPVDAMNEALGLQPSGGWRWRLVPGSFPEPYKP